jgi:hypothetical protein
MLRKLKNIYDKFTNYGYKKNTNDWDCGPVALYNLCKIAKKPLSHKQCIELTSTQKDVGCLVKDFRETLDRLNLRHLSLTKDGCRSLIDIRRWTGTPLTLVICYENKLKDRHMLLYRNDGKNEFLLNDKNKVMSAATAKRVRFLINNSVNLLLIGV